MITVAAADKIILDSTKDYGTEMIPFEHSLDLVLAEDIIADRDLPPCNRVTMDGIAIQFNAYKNGIRRFRIKGAQAAGDVPIEIETEAECVEIMTGAALPSTCDTVIRYEDLDIKDGCAQVVTERIVKGQSIHYKGSDKLQGDVMVSANKYITPDILSVAASTGYTEIKVKKLPKVIVISTGNELTAVHEKPSEQQLRQSNNYTIKAVLAKYGVNAAIKHLRDDEKLIRDELATALNTYDVILLTGGISMGKYDMVPGILESLGVESLFHKVKQRPGKPFWFGIKPDSVTVFAFPGNPVSTFMCLHRYFIPWLKKCLNLKEEAVLYAALDSDYTFTPDLQYFLQVKLYMTTSGQMLASPLTGNGSGDFANLTEADAFMELPQEQTNFKKGEAFRIWPFKSLFI